MHASFIFVPIVPVFNNASPLACTNLGKNCYLFLWFFILYSCAVLFGVFVIGVSCVLYLMMSFQNMITMIPIINS